MKPVFRSKRPKRPDVFVLCDVSDSVRNASRMMLLFTHTLQSLFSRVRSFVFVAELAEVTRLFREFPAEEALNRALSPETLSLYANSDYGASFEDFAKSALETLTRRTTVIILGDGRNNYNPHRADLLEEMKRRSRQLIWLCTEDPRGFGVGDSEMHRYAPHCSRVISVMSLDDLEKAALLLARPG